MKLKDLRAVVRRLGKIRAGQNNLYARVSMHQDTLELAALLAGMKPVFLLGRGFDDLTWVSQIKKIAADLRLEIVEDSCWNVDLSGLHFPEWYRRMRNNQDQAVYITRNREAVSEILKISARGWVSPEEEARLLGYPMCCVEGSHKERRALAEGFFLAALEAADGDEERARAVILADTKFQLPEEFTTRMEAALTHDQCPFTSIFMCPACAANPESPARTLSDRYAKLAKDLDSDLFKALKQTAKLFRTS